jgi:ABC-type Zn uptake system ZnuABC Zn-binding protein ZnuA
VVTTTSVFADLIAQVGGDRVSVTSLVPRGTDPHTFEPKPSDAARIAEADLVVMNGLGLDDWLGKLIESSGTKARVVRLGEDLPGVAYIAGEAAEHPNPHLWLDAAIAALYAERIAEALSAASAADAQEFESGGRAFAARLRQLDSWIRQQIATVPEANRRLVLFHDAFPYFARAYGLEVVGSVVEAPGQDPSAGQMAALVDAIRASGARAVFSEAQFPATLVRRLAEEAGVAVVTDLYTDALGEPPLDSYEAIMRHDVERLVGALR